VNLLDLLILVALAVAGFGGYRLGFVARVASWVGLAVGLAVAAHFLPQIVDAVNLSSPANRLFLSASVLLGGAFVGQGLGLLLGAQLHRAIPFGPVRTVDRVAGAAVGVLGVLVAVWLLLPGMSDVPGTLSRQARNSTLARLVDSGFPAAPNTLQALRRLVGKDVFPRVFEALRPAPDTGPPPAASGLSDAVVRRVTASTVRVEGLACQRLQDGSGFAVAPDLVATNAHVVAGERRTNVFRPDGRRLAATVVLFDSDRDLALLRVAGLGQAPLVVGSGRVGQSGAVFGHPEGVAEVVVAPAAVRQEVAATGRDLYDSRPTRRDVYILAANLHPGDSGGALVDSTGSVTGVAFAIAPDRPGTAYALATKELSAVLAANRGAPVPTGPCLLNG